VNVETLLFLLISIVQHCETYILVWWRIQGGSR